MATVMRGSASSVPAVFAEQVERQRDRLAIRFKEYGIWHRVSWGQYGEEVRRVAAALLAFGLRSTAISGSRPSAAPPAASIRRPAPSRSGIS